MLMDLSAMPPHGRKSLVHALLKQLPEQSSPVVIVVRPEKSAPTPIRTNGHRSNTSSPAYDPSVVFVLEFSTIMATRDPASVELMGQAVADALQAIVRDAANVHPLILSRAVFYLLFLLDASQVNRFFLNKRSLLILTRIILLFEHLSFFIPSQITVKPRWRKPQCQF